MTAATLEPVSLRASLCALGATLCLCWALRWSARRALPLALLPAALEVTATLQLCCCALEQRLAAESGAAPRWLGLGLVFVTSAAHGATGAGATCSPCSALERVLLRTEGPRTAMARVFAQVCGAALALRVTGAAWRLLGGAHALAVGVYVERSPGVAWLCPSPLRAGLPLGAVVEALCALAFHVAAAQAAARLRPTARLAAVSAAVTAIVYAAGSITGGVFNPVLAATFTLGCPGHSTLDYALVYGVAPLIGMTAACIVCNGQIPLLRGGKRDEKTD
ncbi:aquaporin-11 [Petromyzon marinus]|uniref:Aquaporin-12-like n=1 Tax=Petromyzon marinus TaxID=7757 RepID=A0AAJ7U1A2_PETMA|nr:aquaporin-12-like [Petromyzon marinus]